MPPRKSETLTEAELRLMDVLWQKGPPPSNRCSMLFPRGRRWPITPF